MKKAVDLDPTNPKWKEMLDSAKSERARRRNLRDLMNGQAGHAARIGADVAETNLIRKVEPKYPPFALQARI